MFIVEVGLREEWKNKDHPIRKNPLYKVKGVPTLVFIKNDKPVASIMEDDIINPEILKTFLQDFC